MSALNYDLMEQYQQEALAEGADLTTANARATARFTADAARWALSHIGAPAGEAKVVELLFYAAASIKVDVVARNDWKTADAIENAAIDWTDIICGGEPPSSEDRAELAALDLCDALTVVLPAYEAKHAAMGTPVGLAHEAALAALTVDVMFQALRETSRGANPSTMSRTLLLVLRELRHRLQADPDAVERFDGMARAAVHRWCLGGDQPLPVAH